MRNDGSSGIKNHPVVSHEKWLSARTAFLAKDKEFTRLRDESGRRLRGLKIIRSETNRKRMVWAGNLLTAYNYRYVDAQVSESALETNVETFLADGLHQSDRKDE